MKLIWYITTISLMDATLVAIQQQTVEIQTKTWYNAIVPFLYRL
jgi:hypothetical protein